MISADATPLRLLLQYSPSPRPQIHRNNHRMERRSTVHSIELIVTDSFGNTDEMLKILVISVANVVSARRIHTKSLFSNFNDNFKSFAKQKLVQQLHSLNKQLQRRLNRNCIAALHPGEEVLHGHDTKDLVSLFDQGCLHLLGRRLIRLCYKDHAHIKMEACSCLHRRRSLFSDCLIKYILIACCFVVAMPSGKRETERKGNAPVNTGPSPNSDGRANNPVEEADKAAREDEIPFWHRRNSRLSRDELELLKEMNITLKDGAFSEKEDKRVRKNWKRYSRFYNVEYRDFFYIENSEIPDRRSFLKSTNFYAELARKLPWRSSYSVVQRARNILHPNYENHANYTKEQTEALGNFVQEYGRKWAVIGDKLGRTPLSVGYRYKNMRRRKGRFTPEEHTAFIEAIKTYLKKSTESELLNVHMNEIAWSQVREQLPGRTLSQLKNHWCSWILKQTDITYGTVSIILEYLSIPMWIGNLSANTLELIRIWQGMCIIWQSVNFAECEAVLLESFHYDYDAIFEQYHAMMMMIVLCKHVTQCNAHSFQSHDHYNGHMLEDGCTIFGFWCWQE
ncbi:Transcription termination factor 1 [Trichinella nelsoni]|uniref:Transcription termination factor 1 n=1 Tax=Trichinella nelsoni TaxID=6336 RepID=A0A0V0RU71_9BILA|nr:Transcription termination factor 1 [Trichinella nelsoni]